MSETRKRVYYSARTGKNVLVLKPDLSIVLRLFRDCYLSFSHREYFQEAFGYTCVDAGEIPGTLGTDIEAQMYRKLRKENLWPIYDRCLEYTEDDLLDVIEFLYDYVSKPVEGWHHTYSGCGWHYNKFDREAGRIEFQAEINEIIAGYNNGYELSGDGEILALAETGLDGLVHSQWPMYDPENVDNRVQAAIRKFRRYRSSQDDKRDAIRDLADVLEFIRPKLNQVLTRKDESDLFMIANSFGIRHHNDQQRTDYDRGIWYDWMFYYYLATIYTSLALLKREQTTIQQDEELPF